MPSLQYSTQQFTKIGLKQNKFIYPKKFMFQWSDTLGEYLAAAIGSVLGAILAIAVCIIFSDIYSLYIIKFVFKKTDESSGGLFYRAVGLVIGWLIGSFSGCWLALSKINDSNAYLTALLLVVLQPLGLWWFWRMLRRNKVGSIVKSETLELWLRIGFINMVLAVIAQVLTNMLVILAQY